MNPTPAYENKARTDGVWDLELDRVVGTPAKLYAMSDEFSASLFDKRLDVGLTLAESDRVRDLVERGGSPERLAVTLYPEMVALYRRVRLARWFELTRLAFNRVHALDEGALRRELRRLQTWDRWLYVELALHREAAVRLARDHEKSARALRKALKGAP